MGIECGGSGGYENQGYDDKGVGNGVSVSTDDPRAGSCSNGATGLDVTVTITSNVNTYFAQVVGIRAITNTATAVARSCGSVTQAIAFGNAIVALAPSGKAFDTVGTPHFTVSGGGIFSNSASDPAAYCNGNATISAPSVTSV